MPFLLSSSQEQHGKTWVKALFFLTGLIVPTDIRNWGVYKIHVKLSFVSVKPMSAFSLDVKIYALKTWTSASRKHLSHPPCVSTVTEPIRPSNPFEHKSTHLYLLCKCFWDHGVWPWLPFSILKPVKWLKGFLNILELSYGCAFWRQEGPKGKTVGSDSALHHANRVDKSVKGLGPQIH